jgi:hypothetical protein
MQKFTRCINTQHDSKTQKRYMMSHIFIFNLNLIVTNDNAVSISCITSGITGEGGSTPPPPPKKKSVVLTKLSQIPCSVENTSETT